MLLYLPDTFASKATQNKASSGGSCSIRLRELVTNVSAPLPPLSLSLSSSLSSSTCQSILISTAISINKWQIAWRMGKKHHCIYDERRSKMDLNPVREWFIWFMPSTANRAPNSQPICVEMCLQLRGAWHKWVCVVCILRLVYLVSCILRRVYGVNEWITFA